MKRQELKIAYDSKSDTFVVNFYTGAVRRYGTLQTLLNVVTDYYTTTKYVKRKLKRTA